MPACARERIKSGAERKCLAGLFSLPAFLILAAGLGCSSLHRLRPTATGPLPSSTHIAEPSPLSSPTSKPDPTTIPSPLAEFVEPRYSYLFTTAWEDLPSGTVVLYWDLGDPHNIFFYSWDGQHGSLLEVPGAMGGNWHPVLSEMSGTRIALTQGIIIDETETWIDVIDLASGAVQGFSVGCPSGEWISQAVLGPQYLAYGCSRPGLGIMGYQFVPLEAPDQVISRELPAEFGGTAVGRLPHWTSATQVYLESDAAYGEEQTGCIVDILEWEPKCIHVPYWLQSVSPDGQWIETRDAANYIILPERPERVGALPVSCILEEGTDGCEPRWAAFSSDRRELRYYGTWSPDSRYVYFLQGINCMPKYEGYSSDVWRLEVETGELSRVGTIPNRPASDEPYLAPVWSEDASELLVIEGQSACLEGVEPWHALSVETGKLRLLMEDAGIPFAVINKP